MGWFMFGLVIALLGLVALWVVWFLIRNPVIR